MAGWLRFRLGLFAHCALLSGCAVAWSPVSEVGEPLETPAANGPVRATEANVPAAVTATDSEPVEPAQSAATPSIAAKPPATVDDGLEKLIAEGRRQGTLTPPDEKRLREDMAAVPPELRRQIVSTFLALSATNHQKAEIGAGPDEPAKPRGQTPRSASTVSHVTASRAVPKSGEAPAPVKAKSPDSARSATAAVASAAGDEAKGGQWQVMLAATIRSLEESLANAGASAADGEEIARRQAQLRMMYLLAGRREDALRPIAEAEPEVRQFWTDWLYGTATYLDNQSIENPTRRATLAVRQLEDALAGLSAQANLEVCNLAFCRRVTSFGVYESFAAPASGGVAGGVKATVASSSRPRYQFEPNQEVLLYAEVRNFTSRHTDRGYHTALRPSYQIFDSAGRRLGSVTELGESQDYCQHRRRDFFVRYHLYLPSRIDPGDYKLKLTIEDVHSTKVAESTVEFSIGK